MRNASMRMDVKTKETIPCGIPRWRGGDSNKTDFTENALVGVEWINLAHDIDQGVSLVNTAISL